MTLTSISRDSGATGQRSASLASRTSRKPGLRWPRLDLRWPRLGDDTRRFLAGESGVMRLIFKRLFQRPMRTLAVLLVLGFAGLILVNAVALQNERHPAPFFAVAPVTSLLPVSAPLPPARPTSVQRQPSEAELARQMALVRDLQGELARHGFFIGAIDGKPGSRFEIAIREYEKAAGLPVTGQPTEKLLGQVAASKLAMKDQLLLLIKDAGAPASPEPTRTIETVQKALNKLGYGPLKTDGAFGATTKAAIERFEREHKLAVRGEPNGRVLKELAAASGLVVE